MSTESAHFPCYAPISDGFMQQFGRNATVNATADCANDLSGITDQFPNSSDLF
jgi:hypothetical protein